MTRKALLLTLVVALAPAGALWSLSGEEILRLVDRNRDFSSIVYQGTLTIVSGSAERTKQLRVTAEGESKALVEFTNPEDAGTKYLKIDKNLWIYFPSEQDTVRISGNMLKEGMMGSDLSYEDALESDPLYRRYDVQVAADEAVDGRACYVVVLTAKSRDVQYDVRKLWVDRERFIPLKQEMYARSGKLLKVISTLEVRRIDDRYFPVTSEVVDKLRTSSRTRFEMTAVRFDVPLEAGLFSLRNLGR